jgi:hypothetical protein
MIEQAQTERASPPAAPESALAALRRLGELKDAGILTDEEFIAKKADLLRRM